jgi:hypothetical protein
MPDVTPKELNRFAALHARMGSPNENEQKTARRKFEAWLKKHGKTWNDIPELLAQHYAQTQAASPPPPDPRDANSSSDPHPFDAYTPADTVRGMLEQYVALDEHFAVAVPLWFIHTHIYDRFMVTPRLFLKSPVRNCGKTTLLNVASRLVARAEKTDSITAAAIMHAAHESKSTLLLDEADNLEASARATLRAVLHAGYHKGGSRTLVVKGVRKRFDVFAPIALAGIGSLPLPLMSRSIVIHMRRHDGARSLRRFDLNDTTDLDLVYTHIRHWARHVQLNGDPEMPAGMHGRLADNWRPLLSIADACGPKWSALAREAAVAFARADSDEDVGVTLLRHIREVFDACGGDRPASKKLVNDLINLDGADAMWAEYRGVRGDERPRKLTENSLAALLRPFEIRPRRLWPLPRTPESKSFRGYLRADFEESWRSYCDEGVTPSHASHLRLLCST